MDGDADDAASRSWPPSVQLLYRQAEADNEQHDDDYVHSDLLTALAGARRKVGAPCNRGLTSLIYRLSIDGLDSYTSERGVSSQRLPLSAYCLKRVCEDDEVRPHSVTREVECYRLLEEERKRRGLNREQVPIIALLAAFRDESDPFSVEVDLIMPLLTCDLEEALDEPSLQFGQQTMLSLHADHRPSSRVVAEKVLEASLLSFVKSCALELFSALCFLHSCQIAHRDVKPSNILIDQQTLSIKLIDFGTSHVPTFAPGDDGKGGVTCEVGTGPFRAPESLFSPTNGYDAKRLDIWQAGTTLAQFFLPLEEVVRVEKKRERMADYTLDFVEYDQLEPWEKALWADDGGASWAGLQMSKSQDDMLRDAPVETTSPTWQRETLFDATRGDIGLASSMFDLRGLPTSTDLWPEAAFFQPSLKRMPFSPREALQGGLSARFVKHLPAEVSPVIRVIDQCIQLSAGMRISAEEAVQILKTA